MSETPKWSWWKRLLKWLGLWHEDELAPVTPPDHGPVEPEPVDPAPEPVTPGTRSAAAVCVGWRRLDPDSWQGWDGDCPGCDVDAKGMYAKSHEKGIAGWLLLDSGATWDAIGHAVLESAKPLKRDDLLLISESGHGGQLPDDNGDEDDKLDETVCTWNQEVRDDEVLKLIHKLPPGLRVVLISDQCHSEGNFRAMVRLVTRAATFGRYGKRTARALVRDEALTPDEWDGQLIQFAGCREANYSYGAENGGTWTQSLLRTYRDGITWRQWFDAAKARMPATQVPVWVEYGQVTDAFRNGLAME